MDLASPPPPFPPAVGHYSPYCLQPPQEQKDLAQYIVDTVDLVRTTYPDCGVVILGDFNSLDISDINLHHALAQVVRDPTRGQSILDLILTNFSHLYCKPVISAPLGSSDHNIISWKPIAAICNQLKAARAHAPKKCYLRRFPRSSIDAFGRWVCEHRWFNHAHDLTSVDTMVKSFTSDLMAAIDLYAPYQVCKNPSQR